MECEAGRPRIEPTDCGALRYETKSPRPAPGALAHVAGFSLPADLEAGSTTRGAGAGVTVGDHLDPECILVLVVRGVAGLAQRIQAVLRRTRGCGGESRQIKDHPRAFLQFRQGEGHGRPFGGHLDLGTSSYGARYVVLLAIAAENDWRLSRSTSASASAAKATTRTAVGCARTTGAAVTSARTARYRSPASDHRQVRRLRHDRRIHVLLRRRQHSGAQHRPCTRQRSRWA